MPAFGSSFVLVPCHTMLIAVSRRFHDRATIKARYWPISSLLFREMQMATLRPIVAIQMFSSLS
jgi:hypothetical protein